MCKKGNELIHKQQRPAQSHYGMLASFMSISILMIFCYLKQCLLADFAENLLVRKKIQIKAWYRILGTEILSYEEFLFKTMQS